MSVSMGTDGAGAGQCERLIGVGGEELDGRQGTLGGGRGELQKRGSELNGSG